MYICIYVFMYKYKVKFYLELTRRIFFGVWVDWRFGEVLEAREAEEEDAVFVFVKHFLLFATAPRRPHQKHIHSGLGLGLGLGFRNRFIC